MMVSSRRWLLKAIDDEAVDSSWYCLLAVRTLSGDGTRNAQKRPDGGRRDQHQRRFRFQAHRPCPRSPRRHRRSITRSATTSFATPASSISSAATRRRRASRYCRSSNGPIVCCGIPARYEGFECSDNVIYVGASPNHNVLPLVRYVLDNLSRHLFCVGSNYVWTWETIASRASS